MVSELTRPVDPEFATNYEIGMKWENDDHRLRFNPTMFYTTYKDAQRAVNIHHRTKPGGATFQETVFYNAAEGGGQGRRTRVPGADHGCVPHPGATRPTSTRKLQRVRHPPAGGHRPGDGRDDSGVRRRTSPACRCRVRRSSWARSRASTRSDLDSGADVDIHRRVLSRRQEPVLHLGRGSPVRRVPRREEPAQCCGDVHRRRRQVVRPRVRQEPDGRALSHRSASRSPRCGRTRSGARRATSAWKWAMHFGH